MAVNDPRYLEDLPAVPVSGRPTSALTTGTWKYAQPRHQDILAPCARRCPAGNDIPKIMGLAAAGRLEEAAALLRAGNPLPSVLGRVCPHTCGLECNREPFGGRIVVPLVERFLGDLEVAEARSRSPKASTGYRIAVIGAGPAGITAAWLLAVAGHDVEVFDDQERPGGYLRTGIPEYRLPRSVLDRELEIVARTGVRFTMRTRIGRDVHFSDLSEHFHAVIAAVGCHRPCPLHIAGPHRHANVHDGLELLAIIQSGRPVNIPPVVAIIGGGNTAIDLARSLLRLGKRPTVVYRRSRAEMPAIADEVEAATREGIPFCFLAAPSMVVMRNHEIFALECLRMELGAPDESGRRAPIPVPGSEFLIPALAVVTAVGETAELGFVPEEIRSLFSGEQEAEAGHDGLFLAGDAGTGAGTVAAAVGSGRRVAAIVDGYVRRRRLALAGSALQRWGRNVDLTQIAGCERLNSAYISTETAPPLRELPVEARIASFQEVIAGFSAAEAVAEARRCLSCGTCNGCMNCFYFCPDVAIHNNPSGAGFEVDLAHCKGCGICVEECPRGAVALEGVAQ